MKAIQKIAAVCCALAMSAAVSVPTFAAGISPADLELSGLEAVNNNLGVMNNTYELMKNTGEAAKKANQKAKDAAYKTATTALELNQKFVLDPMDSAMQIGKAVTNRSIDAAQKAGSTLVDTADNMLQRPAGTASHAVDVLQNGEFQF